MEGSKYQAPPDAPDIYVDGRGFYTIGSSTQRGHEWLLDNVLYEEWQASDEGPKSANLSIACDDTRYASEIADGAFADGLLVHINGRRYLGDNRVA